MKKHKMKNLTLSKKTVSTLTNLQTIKGGNETHNPGCIDPSDVSDCIRCMESPTEGCGGGGGTNLCFLTTACAPSGVC